MGTATKTRAVSVGMVVRMKTAEFEGQHGFVRFARTLPTGAPQYTVQLCDVNKLRNRHDRMRGEGLPNWQPMGGKDILAFGSEFDVLSRDEYRRMFGKSAREEREGGVYGNGR